MDSHFAFSDPVFESHFRTGQFDPSLFTHEAHLRLAWINLHRYGLKGALQRVPKQLRGFIEKTGKSGRYNETVTIAAIRAVHHFMVRCPAQEFKSFIDQNTLLKYHFRELLSHHYSTDIFNSFLARNSYLAPDLLPFD